MNCTRALLLSAAALTLPLSSCTVYEQPNAPNGGVTESTTSESAESYTPDTYEGNTVYFENDEPYYVVDDEIRYVPHERPEYARFREHHVHFGPAYRRWSAKHPPPKASRRERREERREEQMERRHDRD